MPNNSSNHHDITHFDEAEVIDRAEMWGSLKRHWTIVLGGVIIAVAIATLLEMGRVKNIAN